MCCHSPHSPFQSDRSRRVFQAGCDANVSYLLSNCQSIEPPCAICYPDHLSSWLHHVENAGQRRQRAQTTACYIRRPESAAIVCACVHGAAGAACCSLAKILMSQFRRERDGFWHDCGLGRRHCPTKLKRLPPSVRVAAGWTFKERSGDGTSELSAALRWLGAGIVTIGFR